MPLLTYPLAGKWLHFAFRARPEATREMIGLAKEDAPAFVDRQVVTMVEHYADLESQVINEPARDVAERLDLSLSETTHPWIGAALTNRAKRAQHLRATGAPKVLFESEERMFREAAKNAANFQELGAPVLESLIPRDLHGAMLCCFVGQNFGILDQLQTYSEFGRTVVVDSAGDAAWRGRHLLPADSPFAVEFVGDGVGYFYADSMALYPLGGRMSSYFDPKSKLSPESPQRRLWNALNDPETKNRDALHLLQKAGAAYVDGCYAAIDAEAAIVTWIQKNPNC